MRSHPYDVPRLNLLEGFESAARNLSFTRASVELSLTQSAISRQIKSLEAQLGVLLFERGIRTLRLTPEGEMLYRTVSEVLKRVADTTRAMRVRTNARTFTVTTTPAFASLWLIPRLPGYTSAHPGVDVRISATSNLVDLERAGVDVAIRYTTASLAGAAPRLFGEAVFPVCSPRLIERGSPPLEAPSDLRHHVLLRYHDTVLGEIPSLDWGVWLLSVGLPDLTPAGTLSFNQYDQVIQAAVQGQGIAMGRSPLLKQHLKEGTLVAPFSARTVAPRAYYLVRSPASMGHPDVDAFAAWIAREARREAGTAARPRRGRTSAESPRR